MLEPDLIQMQGFKNIVQDGRASGFQIRARCPYYRGIWASLIERIEVTVDGESFPAESTHLDLGGTRFKPGTEPDDPDLRWAFEDPAVLTVDKPGGLELGLHEVQVSL